MITVTDQINEVSAATKLAVSEVKALLQEGIDLDRISEKTLFSLLMNSSRFQNALTELLKKEIAKREGDKYD